MPTARGFLSAMRRAVHGPRCAEPSAPSSGQTIGRLDWTSSFLYVFNIPAKVNNIHFFRAEYPTQRIVGGRESHNRALYPCSCCVKRSIFRLNRYFRLIGLEYLCNFVLRLAS